MVLISYTFTSLAAGNLCLTTSWHVKSIVVFTSKKYPKWLAKIIIENKTISAAV